MIDAVPAPCGPVFGKLQLLQIVTEPILLGEQQLRYHCSILRRQTAPAEQTKIVVDVGARDMAVHAQRAPV